MKRYIDIEYKNIDIRYIYITSYYRKTSILRYSLNIYIYKDYNSLILKQQSY